MLSGSEWLVLGGAGRVDGTGVFRYGAPAGDSRSATQKGDKFMRDTAGEGCVDPGICAGVQAGQQHQDSKGHP